MRPQIARGKVAQVLKLLQAGLSQREASKASGVSLPVVNRIAQGREAMQFSEDVEFQQVRPYTCPGCERVVTTAPCVACTARRGA
jgi:hypothetical protein